MTIPFIRKSSRLPAFHPNTVLRDWGDGDAFRIVDAQTGVCVFGATGSGKTSGPARHLAYGYLAAGFGGLVLCAKLEERRMWERWCKDTGRAEDLIVVDASGSQRFNFLEWEAEKPGAGGFAINVVNLFDEIGSAVAQSAGKPEGGSGDNKFWEDCLHHLMSNLVDLPILAGLRLSLPLMRSIVNSAPQSFEQIADEQWQKNSVCAAIIREADKLTSRAENGSRADFEECRDYFLTEFPSLGEKTRGLIMLTFSMLVRPFLTRPLRRIFAEDINVRPEDTFEGKILLIDLPVQEYRLAGRMANLVFKHCFQVSVLRRMQPAKPNSFLRPVFLWADEAQNFVTKGDSEYQAVARSAGGCTVYLTQNRESYRRVLSNNDAVDSLLGNLQNKFFCQNAGDTNDWAAHLLGERWLQTNSTNVGNNRNDSGQPLGHAGHSSGVTRSEQKRYFLEPSAFTTLKRGGELNGFQVESIVYKGGAVFPDGRGGVLPCKILTFDQR